MKIVLVIFVGLLSACAQLKKIESVHGNEIQSEIRPAGPFARVRRADREFTGDFLKLGYDERKAAFKDVAVKSMKEYCKEKEAVPKGEPRFAGNIAFLPSGGTLSAHTTDSQYPSLMEWDFRCK